ncbi:carbamoyltransferase HypF [Streptomyces sp. NPDC048172]|uniref:carbamoyltransferase HypF n=1 Tax=Streptomyces sp. NPDC048172 TaxID=3365505 RepID=UPI00371608C2
MNGGERVARGIEVSGTVQGVGFRPFVHRTASALGLDGWVRNVDGRVLVTVAGSAASVRAFTDRLHRDAPPLARVTDVRVGPADSAVPRPGSGFTVRGSRSRRARAASRQVPPDAATCPTCVRELFSPGDRRHRYPFTNCADCGPRATVIAALPYDRERTAMRGFPLCADCAREYHDPADRRFHAEPLACPRCGPRLTWDGLRGEEALRAAEAVVDGGGIVALKGLGGYQLVCDATRAETVATLRRRKHRPDKPFAVMVRDLGQVRALARATSYERALLPSPARPVVLLAARTSAMLTGVHPGTPRIGLFLPTTGLHHLLLRDLDRPLVVTSGNLAGEPLATDAESARAALGSVADGFLDHDRPVLARYDDSVVRASGRGTATLRRARGHAPAPLPLPSPAPVPLVAAGAQSKHTFALAQGGLAYLSPHIGDLESARTLDAFTRTYADLSRLTGIAPRAVAHDPHPEYLSTRWARALPGVRRVPVQHHHAHIAACAAEHGLRTAVTGVAYDGLGLGDDGTLWGGEVLVADLTGYRRVARFATAPLPGGAAAVRHPARMALGHLYGAEPPDPGGAPGVPPALAETFAARLDPREADVVRAMIARDLNCPRASSAGRLFDTAASLLGLCDTVSYEGQAAVALETAAGEARPGALPWHVHRAHRAHRDDGLAVFDPVPTLVALLEGRAAGRPVRELAAAFHTTLAQATRALVTAAVDEGAPETVCLAGGCFQNRRLLAEVRQELRAAGLRVLTNHAVPCGDGGLSYGQAAVAAARLTAEE